VIDVDVDLVDADRMFGGLLDGLDNPDRLLAFFGEKVLEHERLMFATRGGGTWAALDPDTVAEKGSTRVLVDTGGLLDALSGRYRIAGESVSVTTNDVAAIMAQRGVRGAPVRDPAPEPSPSVVRGWGEDLLDGLIGGVG